jgi:hypothetical protein
MKKSPYQINFSSATTVKITMKTWTRATNAPRVMENWKRRCSMTVVLEKSQSHQHQFLALVIGIILCANIQVNIPEAP